MIILGWAWVYVRLCLVTLAAPGRAITFRYLAPAGAVVLRADSYIVDLPRQTILLTRPQFIDPRGGVVASARYAELSRFDWKKGGNQPISVSVVGLDAKLIRYATGRFQLADLLPSHGKSSGGAPFQVLLNDSHVRLVDEVGGKWTQDADAKSVIVSGVGQNWIAAATVNLHGIGNVTACVTNAPGHGLTISGSTAAARAEGLLRHVLSLPQIAKYGAARQLSFRSVLLSGPFQVQVPPGTIFRMDAAVHMTVDDFAYGRYRLSTLDFAGRIGNKGAQGLANFTLNSDKGTFQGAATWAKAVSLAGQVTAKVATERDLPDYARERLPAGLQFDNAVFSGWISQNPKASFQARGAVQAARLEYGHNPPVSQISAFVQVTPTLDQVRLAQATANGIHPSGAVQIDTSRGSMHGYVAASGVKVEQLPKPYQVRGVSGLVDGQVILDGTFKAPQAGFAITGSANYTEGKLAFHNEKIDVVGSLAKGVVLVKRAVARGSAGTLSVSGTATGADNVAMHVEARNISAGHFYPGLTGSLAARADLSGSLTSFRYLGRAEAAGLQFKDYSIPAASADFSGNRDFLFLDRVAAVSSTASLLGSGMYEVRSRAMAGKFKVAGISATNYLGDSFAGLIDLPDVQLGGTLYDPLVTARVETSNFVASDMEVESAEGFLRYADQKLTLDHATAAIAQGNISASGAYDLRSKTGVADFSSTPLALQLLGPELGETVSLGGTTALKRGHVEFSGASYTGQVEGDATQISVNGAPVGDGNWTADAGKGLVHANLSIGQLLPQLRVLNVDATYDLHAKTLTASADADSVRLQDLLAAGSRYLPPSIANRPEIVTGISGDLTIGLTASGPINRLDLAAPSLQIVNLSYSGSDFGTLSASNLTRKDGNWSVPSATLSGQDGLVTLKGTLGEDGILEATATGTTLKLAALSVFAPTLAQSPGTLNFNLQASGPYDKPSVSGKGRFTDLAPAPEVIAKSTTKDSNLTVDISDVSVDNSHAKIKGTYAFGGFGGGFGADAPFSYEKKLADIAVTGRLTLDSRPILAIPVLANSLDPQKSSGDISGFVDLSGTLGEPALTGSVALTAPSIGIKFADNSYLKKIDDNYKNVNLALKLTADHRASLSLSAQSERGGDVKSDIVASLQDLGAQFGAATDANRPALLDSPISGSFAFNQFKLRQSAPGGYVAGEISGSANMSGTLRRPVIGTRDKPGIFTLTGVDSSVPTIRSGTAEGGVPTVDPSFNLEVKLANTAHIRSTSADFFLTGSGGFRGLLSDPRADANLVVQSGSIRLPGGTLRLSQGGTVDFSYRKPFGDAPNTTLDVDLVGQTGITAMRYGTTPEHYDITVDITGDMLTANALQMSAISDPPDLNSDDVLALLGQKDLFESIGANTNGTADTERRVTNAVAGFALPNLLDPVTSSISKGLGLDYVSLDYNELDLATVSAARALTPELSLQLRQQLGPAYPGTKPITDFRAIYSPRHVSAALRRFSIGAGYDQDHPWKVILQYGSRFGPSSSGPGGKKTVISP